MLFQASRVVRGMSTAARPVLSNAALLRDKSLVNGQWITASSGKQFKVYDPAAGTEIGSVPDHGPDDYGKAIAAAKEVFASFKQTGNRQRGVWLHKWAELLRANQDDLAAILTWENGKPIAEAKGEIAISANYLDWFAEEAPRIYGDTIPSQDPTRRIHTIRQPVGVCGIITPWNFPASMIARKIGAVVATGCTAVIKPASETPYSALALGYLAAEAGIPDGVINVLTTESHVKEVGKEICENPLVSKVTFTGSTAVGKILMSQAASTVKKVSFELGGNAPFIVFEDADIDAAVEGAIACKFRGSGQTCVCANRIYVHEAIYEEFAKKFAAKVGAMKVGHGFEEATSQGPVINGKSIDKVDRHVRDAEAKGATVLVGGKKLPELGENFYAPTVLTNVGTGMDITVEETFGPVAAVIKFATDEEAIRHANSVEVGLAGYIYTKDNKRVHKITEALEVGMIGVNVGVITEPALPFGGVKESGFGREGSKYGLDDFLVIKSVVTNLA